MTVAEFWAFSNLPENAARNIDLIAGGIVEWPRPNRRHGVVCARTGALLGDYLERTGIGYVVGANAGIILCRNPDSVVGPDVAVLPL